MFANPHFRLSAFASQNALESASKTQRSPRSLASLFELCAAQCKEYCCTNTQMHKYTITHIHNYIYTIYTITHTNTQTHKIQNMDRHVRIVIERWTYVGQKLDIPLAKPVQKVDGVERGW